MNKETGNHIDELISDSGLFPSKFKNKKNLVSFDFSNEIILITGAAGSIGSGLTKQLLDCKYKKLILVDVAESPLYELIKELEFVDKPNVEFVLLNITDEESLKDLFETHKPSIVFHTAAYKHVPLMENNAYEAVKLNIFGTKSLADLSIKCEVKKFIFISTDKAVNPISVMGMTKHIGETYLGFLNKQSKTKFITTRFGNIFGSNGSVVPLFKKQIEFGYPLTITNNDISRYFISKFKACNLILKLASASVYQSNSFTFYMGKPIKIVDIIERLLLCYDTIENNPEIKVIGLRSGEKLTEDIVSDDEVLLPTDDDNILAIKQKSESKLKTIDFTQLFNITPRMANKDIKSILIKNV